MKFKRSEVFEMVDALFHKYASSYREEAKEELADMIQRREDIYQPAEEADVYPCRACGEYEAYQANFCPGCGRALTV